MNQWEQFRHILENTLPSYKHWTNLSLEYGMRDGFYYYVWQLRIKNNSDLYEEILSISKFCGIEWEHMFHTSFSYDGEMILETNENNRELIEPVYW
jgi:hypothetical protein